MERWLVPELGHAGSRVTQVRRVTHLAQTHNMGRDSQGSLGAPLAPHSALHSLGLTQHPAPTKPCAGLEIQQVTWQSSSQILQPW